MSTLTHGQRAQAARREREQAQSTQGTSRRPYFVINGATMVVIAAIALTVIGILYLIQTSQVAQLGYDLSRLQTQRDAMTLEISELEYEVARYESLQTVENVATDRLGMTPMSNYAFIELREPAQRNLEIPPVADTESRSFFERIADAVLGVGSAESERIDMTQYTLGE
jgi:cell division protein FtsL